MPNSHEVDQHPELIKKRARAIAIRNFAIAIVLGWMFFTSAITTWGALSGDEARDTIVDCVTPEGKCAKRGQQNTGQVVKQIIDEELTTRRYSILAATCATDPNVVNDTMLQLERIDAVDKCVQDGLKREEEEKENGQAQD